MRTFERMAMVGLKDLRLPLRPAVFHGRAVVITINAPPHHLTDKVSLHNFLSSFSSAKFRHPQDRRKRNSVFGSTFCRWSEKGQTAVARSGTRRTGVHENALARLLRRPGFPNLRLRKSKHHCLRSLSKTLL